MGCGCSRSQSEKKATVSESAVLPQPKGELLSVSQNTTFEGHSQAHGKVLLTGGYLILFPQYSGLSFSLTAGIHCRCSISFREYDQNESVVKITVQTPQWVIPVLQYEYDSHSGYLVDLQDTPEHRSVFISRSLQVFLSYFNPASDQSGDVLSSIHLFIQADPVFASNHSSHLESTKQRKKSGFGSSAAVTVAVISSLMVAWQKKKSLTNVNKRIIYALCQAAHFSAQNKIGSGFDIATCLFGSIEFTRNSDHFHRSISAVISQHLNARDSGDSRFAIVDGINHTQFLSLIHSNDIPECGHFKSIPSVPSHFQLVFLDQQLSIRDTHTPSFVRELLKWRESHESECDRLFDLIQEQTDRVMSVLSNESDEQWTAVISQCLRKIVSYQRELSEQIGIEIAPKATVKHLDALLRCDDIVGFGFPGAGGFDSCYVIVDSESHESAVELVKRGIQAHCSKSALEVVSNVSIL